MMSQALFNLSAFGDEIDDDLGEQLQLLRQLKISYLEFRSAWGKNVLALSDEEVSSVRKACLDQGMSVSCIGSPIGKTPILSSVEEEMNNLSRIFEIAERLHTRRVRIFSFYPPDTGDIAEYDAYVDDAISRLSKLAHMARQEGFELLLENEKGIVGDTPQRCRAIVAGVDNPHLRFLWDPANFVQVGTTRPMEDWPLLSEYVAYVHVKDARSADGTVSAAGEGDGQLRELLLALQAMDYVGFLALEPHLAHAGSMGGFTGPAGMRYAAEKLRQLMKEVGAVEQMARG